MTSFDSYIKGRRVVFVGACPILQGLWHGDFIDSFDVVVRSNGSISLIESEEFQKDFGKRCDVLYTNNQYQREMRPLPILDYVKKGVKYLRMKTCKSSDLSEYRRVAGISVEKISDEILIEVKKNVPDAVMGIIIAHDILRANPAEFYMTGIDFFISRRKSFQVGNYREYVAGYLPPRIVEQGNQLNIKKGEDGHDIFNNTRYFYSLKQKHSNFRLPAFIEKIMNQIVKERADQVNEEVEYDQGELVHVR